ncbi:Copper amine oxidase [Acinetobacter baumannii]|nr:Copper amine oxidase [Acinetobacter baumannii]
MRKQRLLNDIQKILALNLSIAASFWGLNTQAFAHGGKADMVSLYQNMSEQGAKVVKDDFTNYLYNYQRLYSGESQAKLKSGFSEWQTFKTQCPVINQRW